MDERTEAAGGHVFAWMTETLGPPLLAYLLNCDSMAVQALSDGDHVLTDEQLQVMEALSAFRGALSQDLHEAGVRQAAIRHWLLQVGDDGQSNAMRLRALTCQTVTPAPADADEVEATFVALARAVYPAFLMPSHITSIPSMPELTALVEETDERIPALIAALPAGEEFIKAVLANEELGGRFGGMHAPEDAYVHIYVNAGWGGPVYLRGLPTLMLWAAWREVRDADASEARFVAEALGQLAIVRRVLSGRTAKVKAKFAFTGVLLPTGARVDLGEDGVVRPVTDADRRHAPSELQQKLGGAADDQGNRPYITYAGDIVFDFPYPYRAWIPRPSDDVTAWQEKVPQPREVDQTILWLRIGLVLAVQREQRTYIAQTWQHINDPLASGLGLTWRDPQCGRGFFAVELTTTEVDAWGKWYHLLRASNAKRIELAISRIVRAIAERREPADVLIDSVIAWENIFGTPEGEPTFRVTSCLAKLLTGTLAERQALQKELKDIYRLRSSVVHGNRSLTEADFGQCDRALDVAIAATRILVDKRSDLLAYGDGGTRSTALLLSD